MCNSNSNYHWLLCQIPIRDMGSIVMYYQEKWMTNHREELTEIKKSDKEQLHLSYVNRHSYYNVQTPWTPTPK